MRKRICILMAFLMVLFSANISAKAWARSNSDVVDLTAEEKVYCQATIEDNFADDMVLVVMSHEASMKFDNYDSNYFAEIGCERVVDYSNAARNRVKEKLDVLKNSQKKILSVDVLTKYKGVKEDGYCDILGIVLKEKGKDKVLEAIKILEKRTDIISAEPDYILKIENPISSAVTATKEVIQAVDSAQRVAPVLPNDPYLSEQWGHTKIQLIDAWNKTTGSSTVKVGIIDSGIDYLHSDIAANYVGGCEVRNEQAYEIDTSARDPNGHGTHVAGIVGAKANNNEGIAGVCCNVGLVAIKINTINNTGTRVNNLIVAIDYAIENDVKVLNCSMGINLENSIDTLGRKLYHFDGVFVQSAGNDNINVDNLNNNDMVYRLKRLGYLKNYIVVGASTIDDRKCDFSNYGKQYVDIFAPGENILSCYPIYNCSYSNCGKNGHVALGYHSFSGTSMASPYVAGVAALLYSKCPTLEPEQIKLSILCNVDIVKDSNGNSVFGDYCSSGGRLNAYKALSNPYHDHVYRYKNKSVAAGHICTCIDCGEVHVEGHTWVSAGLNGDKFQCTKCRVITDYINIAHPGTVKDDEE